MIALAASILLVQGVKLPENPSFDFSGIPEVQGANIAVQSHSVTFELNKDYADVTSLTLVKNNGPAGKVSITIPRAHVEKDTASPAHFAVTATWANRPVVLGQTIKLQYGSNLDFLGGSGAMVAGGSYPLRISYRVPLGKCGFDRKQLVAAYDLASAMPISQLNVTYRYARGVVFHLPEAHPDLGWQIGTRGVFVRLNDYQGDKGLTYVTFYPGGFKDIGK